MGGRGSHDYITEFQRSLNENRTAGLKQALARARRALGKGRVATRELRKSHDCFLMPSHNQLSNPKLVYIFRPYSSFKEYM